MAVNGELGDASVSAELAEFVAAIDCKRKPFIDGVDGIAAIRVATACGESLAHDVPLRWMGSEYELVSSS